MHAESNTCMRQTFGCIYQILGACIWSGWLHVCGRWVQVCGCWVQSIWILLSHPITVSQCYVMDEDAALEAQAPEGAFPHSLAPFWAKTACNRFSLNSENPLQSTFGGIGSKTKSLGAKRASVEKEHASTETRSPAGSTTDGALTGKPSSVNSVAQTNSCMALHAGSGNREAVTRIGSSK